jgi:hypothetical protein
MNIVLGINSLTCSDVSTYINNGVDEFFLGYLSKKWLNLYGWEIGPNRRVSPVSSFTDINLLAKTVDYIHSRKKKVFLTLNDHEFSKKQVSLIIDLLKIDLSSIKIDALIIGNIALMLEIRKNKINIPFHISIAGGCNNIETVKFYNKHIPNIIRVILPRKLTISEIESIAKATEKLSIKVEVFGGIDTCFWNDEYCFSWHNEEYGLFCGSVMNRHAKPSLIYDELLDDVNKISWKRIQEDQNKLLDYEFRYKVSRFREVPLLPLPERLSFLSVDLCCLCAIKKFKQMKIKAIKIPGRGITSKINIELIKLINKVINSKNADIKFCQGLIGSQKFCSGSRCFYNFPYN